MIIQPIVDTVRRAYGNPSELGRLIEFHTDHLPSLWAKRCVAAIGRYNQFHPKLVNEAIKRSENIVDSWVIGREYSPVIYCRVYDLTPAKEEKIIQAFSRARADEIDNVEKSFLNSNQYHWGNFRFWWD